MSRARLHTAFTANDKIIPFDLAQSIFRNGMSFSGRPAESWGTAINMTGMHAHPHFILADPSNPYFDESVAFRRLDHSHRRRTLNEEQEMIFAEQAEVDLQTRDLDLSFWDEFEQRYEELLTLRDHPTLTMCEVNQQGIAFLGTLEVSRGHAAMQDSLGDGNTERIHSARFIKLRQAYSTLDCFFLIGLDQERASIWERTRRLCGDLRAYNARISHLILNSHALRGEKLPDFPTETGFFSGYRRLTDRMDKSGELMEREKAYHRHLDEKAQYAKENSAPDPVFISEPGTQVEEILAALEFASAQRDNARDSLVTSFYGRLVEIGDQFGPWYERLDRPPMQRTKNRLSIPSNLRSYTFPELMTVQRAIGDGPTGRHWEGIDGEIAMRHALPSETLQTKFVPSARYLEFYQNSWALAAQSHNHSADLALMDNLRGGLEQLTFDANLLLTVCLSLVIEAGSVSASLDELGRCIGLNPKTAVERDHDRLNIWRWLLMLDSCRVVGVRKGIWREPHNRKKLRDLSCNDDLLHISGTLSDVQMRLDGVPFEVSLTAGPWVEKFRGDKSVCTYLGNVRKLAAKPRGRLPAQLAVTIGLALLQTWREKATHNETQVKTIGDQNRLSIRFEQLTPLSLLRTFGTEPAREFEALLFGADDFRSDHPGVTIKYWNQAIEYLKQWGIVGFYKVVPPKLDCGYEWQKDWYKNQKLDIRPAHGIVMDLAEIISSDKLAKKDSARGGEKILKKYSEKI